MPRATRSSTRASQGEPDASSPPQGKDQGNADGSTSSLKRKASTKQTSPKQNKRAAKSGGQGQQTLEQTMPDANDEADEQKGDKKADDEDMKDETERKPEKGQKTLEESMSKGRNADAKQDVEMKEGTESTNDKRMEQQIGDADMEDAANKAEEVKDVDANGTANRAANGDHNGTQTQAQDEQVDKPQTADNAKPAKAEDTNNATTGQSSKMDSTGTVSKTENNNGDQPATTTDDSGAIQSSQSRGEAMPSNILERGLIYFFIRPRVGMDQSDASGPQDIARSYMVLRPLPSDGKLTDGAINDLGNNRLLALPKKVLPRTHNDKFMTFVEKAGVSMDELKKDFMQGSTYDTATTGVRHTPPVTPIGEGVYAITTTGRESHLCYMLTIPAEMGNVQEEMGLADKGAFVLSIKNPTTSGPANTNLPEGAKFPDEIMKEFHGLRWMPCQPKHLDYVNAQLLLIGEAFGELGKAVQADAKDEKDDGRETAEEEMEKLEGEDEARVEGLKGDETIFEDLGISRKEYPKVATTW